MSETTIIESWAPNHSYFLTQLGNAQQLYGTAAVDAYVRGTFHHSNNTRYFPNWVPFVGTRRSGVLGQLLVLQLDDEQIAHKAAGRFEFLIVRRV